MVTVVKRVERVLSPSMLHKMMPILPLEIWNNIWIFVKTIGIREAVEVCNVRMKRFRGRANDYNEMRNKKMKEADLLQGLLMQIRAEERAFQDLVFKEESKVMAAYREMEMLDDAFEELVKKLY